MGVDWSAALETREPLDDVLEPEGSRVLRGAFELITEKDRALVQDIIDVTKHSAADLALITGLAPGLFEPESTEAHVIQFRPRIA